MHPLLQRKTIPHSNARHTAGRFVSCYFPAETLHGLTKVNKEGIISLKSNNCKCLIFPLVKTYNNIKRGNLTILQTNPINLLTHYPINNREPNTLLTVILVT